MRYFYLSIFLTTLLSCNNYRYIDIQVLNPGLVKIPQKVDELIVVDPRIVNPDISQIEKNNSNIPLFQLANNIFCSNFKKNIETAPIFEEANIIFPSGFFHDSIKAKAQEDTLKRTLLLMFYYKILIDTTKANIATKILIKDFDMLTKEYIAGRGPIRLAKYGYYRVYYKFQFMLDDVTKNRILDWYEWADNFLWIKEKADDDGSQSILDIGKEAAEKYVHRLAPSWITEERMMYYAGNRLMRNGYKSFCENNLDYATIFWKKLYKEGTKRLASMAAYNIALVCEIQDNLDECENWLEKSIQINSDKEVADYLEKIRKRKLTRITIDQNFFQ